MIATSAAGWYNGPKRTEGERAVRETKNPLPPWLGAALAVVLLYVGMEALGVTCPIRFFTGVSCAGCGVARAWLALLRGGLRAAWNYHPLFWLPIPTAGLFLLRRRIPRRALMGAIWTGAALFLLVYALRMADPGDSVVTFAPRTGFFYRIVFGS